jgi:hypothetical protein
VWRDDLDDATQEVFVECFRQGGAVEVAGAGRVPDFRAFLHRGHPQRRSPVREPAGTYARPSAETRGG